MIGLGKVDEMNLHLLVARLTAVGVVSVRQTRNLDNGYNDRGSKMTKAMRLVAVGAILLGGRGRVMLAQSMPAPAPTSTAPTAALRTEVRLVVVDATVLDKHGAPVKGLKADDFQLSEDNAPQKIMSVEEHGASAIASAVQAPIPQPDGSASISNKPVNGAVVWNVLLVDLLNTPKEEQAITRKRLLQFVKQLPADQPVALLTMTGQVNVLVPFQDGAGGIAALLDKNGLLPVNSPVPTNIWEGGEETLIQGMGMDESGLNPAVVANKSRVDVERQAQRERLMMNHFSAIAQWLTNYRGRKNVYWLSAGFPLEGAPFGVAGHDQMHPTGAANTGGQPVPIQDEVDKQLESARVAIYPIDVHGVAVSNIDGETSVDSQGVFVTQSNAQPVGAAKDDQLKAAVKSEMLDIATATGGVAGFSNDILRTLKDDFDQSQNYYTLSYTPSNTTWNGAYRKIHLGVQENGYRLVYREGYYAKDLKTEPPPTMDQFKIALRHGAPPATSVLFSAKLKRSQNSAEAEFAIEPSTLQFQPNSSGDFVADIQCAMLGYDATGKLMSTSLIRVTTKVNPQQRALMNTTPLLAKQSISLAPGVAWLTLGIRDQSTGLFGNLEVPLDHVEIAAATQQVKAPVDASMHSDAAAARPSKGLIHRVPGSAEEARRAERHITLDVVVNNGSGKPVGGLKQQDFTIMDNKREQKIASFRALEGHTAEAPVEVILLLDTMNTSFDDVAVERQGVEKFLRQNGGNLALPVSIVFLSDVDAKLNQSSRDGNALAVDIEKLATPIRTVSNSQGMSGWMERFQRSVRTLTHLSTYEATKPGRKILIWIGPGWPLLSGSGFRADATTQARFFATIVQLSTQLREARLTLYSVAPLDLSRGSQLRTFVYQSYLKGVENARQADSGNLAVQVLAHQSGGLALDPSGDLATQIARCVGDTNAYYEISFGAIPAEKPDEYHGLEVKLDRAGLTARTNTAYYAQP